MGALYRLAFLGVTPFLLYYGLTFIFGPSVRICQVSVIYLLFLVALMYLWPDFPHVFEKSTKKIEWGESETEVDENVSATKKYSVDERSTKEKKGIFSRLLGGVLGREKKCEKCGTELEYKEGAGAYYCPECKEYRWKE